MPWTTVEAERADTNGVVIRPDFVGMTAAREASGRQCVRLGAAGQFVELVAPVDANGIVVRYSIPDSPDGRGIDATLGLYVNGTLRQKLPMTSRLCHLYGAYPFNNDPAAGSPRHFWDELRAMPGDIRRGDRVRLQRDADDTATEYLIDLIDLEPVPPPLERPTGAVSVTDHGAIADGKTDARPAFEAAIAAATATDGGGSVWIPPGRFLMRGPIHVEGVRLSGAGMWHSTLVGDADYGPADRVAIYGTGSNVALADFAIDGNLNYRNDDEPNDGIGGTFGTGSTIRNVWVEHTKVGAWIVNSDGLIVEGCRFRNAIADGINVCIGMRNTIVRDCTARGTGDDCFAMWPATYAAATGPAGNNRFVNCTGQLPFLAQAFSIYGGDGNAVENCLASDVPYGAGLFASTTFPTPDGFGGVTRFERCQIVRCGDDNGAIGTVADRVDLRGLRVADVEVIDSGRDGVRFTSINGRALGDATFDRVRIVNAGAGGAGYGVSVAKGAVGSATLRGVEIVDAKSGRIRQESPAFELIERPAAATQPSTRQATPAPR